ncbi:glucose-dependent insulinotropic receptor-like [Haliotis asinina]|uniref:glucose-dependent insulinotropic receptor-like n=1 Tax=Haliotis asinina TaxID=109174 RepID=UPI003531D06F
MLLLHNLTKTADPMTSLASTPLPETCEPDWDNAHERVKRIVLIPLSVCIILSNGAVLLFIALQRKFHRPTYSFVTLLGIADMCIGFVSIGAVVTKANESTLNECLGRIGFTVSGIQVSTMCVMWIAVDRYIAITRALRYTQIMTTRRVVFAMLWITIQSLLIGFAPLIGWNTGNYNQYCSFLFVVSPGYVVLIFIIGVLPILIVFVIYVRLYCSARGHIKRIDALEQLGVTRKSGRLFGISARNWKSVKTLLCVIGCLLITWCPFLIATVVQLVSGDKVSCFLKEIIGTYLLMLGFSNSFLNPLIYAVGTKDFRDNFRNTIKRQCCPAS